MKLVLASLIFTALPLACNNSTSTETIEERTVALPPRSEQKMEAVASADEAVANAGAEGEAAPVIDATIEQKIIKTASLRFETADMDTTYSQIQSAVKNHGAQIQNDTEGKDYSSIYRNIVIRIPNQKFDAFITDVGKGVSYFDRKEISASDVTEEYIDVDARVKAKKVLEARYLELLKKASKVSEMLEIERELANVREEIESHEGRLKYLQNHVSMSTVNIEFYKKTDVQGGVTVSYGSKMWNALKSGFNGISAFFIGVLYMWPLIIILVAVFFFVRKKIKNRKIM